MSKRSVALTALLIAAAGAALPTSAFATFPGQNGAIVYSKAKYDKAAKTTDYFGPGALYTVLPDGSGTTALPDDPAYNDLEPAWSPDGTRLAYASFGATRYTGIYTTKIGSSRLKLVAKANWPDAPAWAPNGTDLAYIDYAKGLYVVDTTTKAKPRLLLRNPKGFVYGAPAYSADGSRLYFSRQNVTKSDAALTTEIWASDPSGANARQILGGSGELQNAEEPDVSPDSRQLVLAAYDHAGQPGGVWVANADGSGARKVAASRGGDFYSGPAWSPDGTKIVACLQHGSIKEGTSLVIIDPLTGATTILRKARKTYMGTVSWQSVPDATPAS